MPPPSTTETGRVLLLMTTRTYRAASFLDAARRIQAPVVVGTETPQVLGAANPAGNLTLPFARPRAAVRLIRDFAAMHPLAPLAAVVAADDDGVVLAAHAAAALDLAHNSVEAVKNARNKHRMRQVLARNNLACPFFLPVPLSDDPDRTARQVPFPCVLKPLARSASQGVIRADDPGQFVAAFHRITGLLKGRQRPSPEDEDTILVEGFIPGVEVALEGLLSQGELRVLALFDKPDPLDGPFFEETLYVTPSRLPAEVRRRIVQTTALAARALGLRHGPVHAELRVNDAGAWILEVAPRSIGGLCSRSLRFDPDVSLEELILRHALGQEVDSLQRERQASGVMMIPIPRAGVLEGIEGETQARNVPGIDEIRITVPKGQEVLPPPEGNRYLGFIFARRPTPAGVEEALREAHGRLTFKIAARDADAPEGPGGASAAAHPAE